MTTVVIFVLAIVAMIAAIAKFKVHPFLAIMAGALIFGLVAGVPVADSVVDGVRVKGLAAVIGDGFASTFSSIGLVIIFGSLIGALMETTGAALKLADMVIKLVGKKHPVLAMELMGWVTSILVFCDSGFVILNPVRKALVSRTGASSVAMTMGLASGLYISHVSIPPAAGPMAAASTLGMGDQILTVMLVGAVCSVPPLIAALIFATFIGKRVKADDEADADSPEKSYEQMLADKGQLPQGFAAVAPILVPIVLMALASLSPVLGIAGGAKTWVMFLGKPIMALAAGLVVAIALLVAAGKLRELRDVTERTLKTIGPILFLTAAGGVLGKVISASDMMTIIESNASSLQKFGIFFPFLLAAILKTAQGSSTVAITTTAGMIAPMMSALGLTTPIQAALACVAIGAGSMTVSHANDSYFWVVTNFGAMSPDRGYKTQTLSTLIMGVASICGIYLLSLFLA